MNKGYGQNVDRPYDYYEPRVSCGPTGTSPNLGTELAQLGAGTSGWWSVINGWCVGNYSVEWGTGGTEGAGLAYYIELPVAGLPGNVSNRGLADYSLGQCYFAASGLSIAAQAYIPVGTINGEHGKWFNVIIPPAEKVGTVTVASGTASTTVTHGFAVTPGQIWTTPKGSWITAGMTQFWVDTIGATTFRMNATAAAAGNLVGNMDFSWRARVPVATFGPSSPVVYGTVLDHIEGAFMYPVA